MGVTVVATGVRQDAVEKVVAKAKDGLEDVKEGIEGAVEGLKNSFKK